MTSFDYERAFVRNRGLVSDDEQRRLQSSRVAIAGAGGIGGVMAHTLARMGIGKLRIADPDRFDVVNFNRQGGATITTIGQPKASSVADNVRAINPTIEAEAFDCAIDSSNVDSFLEGVDLIVDAIDFFCLPARINLARAARARGIPVIFSAPLGMSATLLIFTADSMPLEEYFDFKPGMSEVDQLVAFLVGICPRMSQRPYMDMRFTNVAEQFGPSLAPAVMLGAGVLGVEVLRLLLGRPGVCAAPHYLQFDAYRRRLFTGRLRLGNRNPIQRFKRFIAKRMLTKLVKGIEPLRAASEETDSGIQTLGVGSRQP